MKQLKFLAVAFTLLMGISLTSCLNSDSDPYSYGGGMVKVNNYMGMYTFTGANGVTITPTSASINALETNGFKMSEMSGKVAQIYYRWDSSLLNIAADEKDIKGVELYSIESLDNTVAIVSEKGAANDSLSKSNNAAIISMESTNSGLEYKPQFYDETTILLPINYYISQKRHFLTLVYYPNEDNNGTLRLYLSHNSNGDADSNGSTSYSLTANSGGYYGLGLFYKTYNLTGVFNRYGLDHGTSARPTTVEIVTRENQYNSKLNDDAKEKVYTVTYKAPTDK
ncbi:hypothetical protein AAE250_17750 [Bacteroides sp. GD17]|jgi:hypothetical protein|uniref:hypothetical protein n=1 Tax=Bacteroides sp. GD17 TaxID=3139826 RepID=UPI0025E6C13A|nr:hypothetical protein [uncultured Bacteroides sp.]